MKKENKPDHLHFQDIKTGVIFFSAPAPKSAAALAAYCVAHDRRPDDFRVLGDANQKVVDTVLQDTREALVCSGIGMVHVGLSPREREVLTLVCNNQGNKQIAHQLSISVRTAKFHVSALLAKFKVDSRSKLRNFSYTEVSAQS